MYRILYAGDSTVTFNKIATYPQTGLSQGLLWYLKDDVFMKSYAVNGRSTKSFIDEGRLDLIADEIKEGDFFFIEFGHNDEKESDPARYAPAFTDYKANLIRMIRLALDAKAYPLVITPLARRLFGEDGRFCPGSHGDYPMAAIEAAEECGVPYIDLTRKSEEYLSSIGDFASRPMFMYPKDNSHLSCHGAVIFAGFIADGLLKLGKNYSELLVPRNSKNYDENRLEPVDGYMVRAKGKDAEGSISYKDETCD